LVISNVHQVDVGPYQVAISNSVGSALSDPASLALDSQPPLAGEDGLLVRQGQVGVVPTATLLLNDSDPESGLVAVTGVDAVSEQGATVRWVADQVSYTPTPTFVGSDAFGYTVADPQGLSSTGRVAVLVYAEALPGPNRLTIVPCAAGYRLNYVGTPGRACELRRSADLEQWEVLLRVTVPPHGVVEYIETRPPPAGSYYRALQP
jgi:hypothetical protein